MVKVKRGKKKKLAETRAGETIKKWNVLMKTYKVKNVFTPRGEK